MGAQTEKQGAEKGKAWLILCAVLAVLIPPVGILLLLGSLFSSLKKKEKSHPPRRRAEEPVRWDSRQDSGKKSHSHTPVQYSYDACALDRRLEQLEVLYKAGLYTKEQYRAAKAKILGK